MKLHKIIVLTCSLLFAVSALAQENYLTLAVHEQRTLDVPDNLERIAVGDPEIADVMVLGGTTKKKGRVLLVGKKPGRTGITAWKRNGEVVTWQATVQTKMQSKLAADGGAELQIADNNALIQGQAPSLLSHAHTTSVASNTVGKEKLLDTSTIATGGMVQIDVKIVELSKKVLKEAGFDFLFRQNRGAIFSFGLNQFPNQIASSGTPVSQAFNLLGSGSVDARMRLIEENGLGRVLAQPSLTALSGQSASFLAGGELPIPQSGGLGTTTIVFKPFGIGLTVTPTVLSANRIALKVAPEASDIDYMNALLVNDISIPAITTRRAETTLELGDGESFVIGGLVSRTTKSNVAKIPLLGDLPIIGTFFRNMSYSQDEKELVILVTPHLVKPIAKGTKLALPGQDREKRDSPGNAWGSYVLGIAGRDELPGFSK